MKFVAEIVSPYAFNLIKILGEKRVDLFMVDATACRRKYNNVSYI